MYKLRNKVTGETYKPNRFRALVGMFGQVVMLTLDEKKVEINELDNYEIIGGR